MSVKLSRGFAERTSAVVDKVERLPENFSQSLGSSKANRRQTRYYKTPPAGIPLPAAADYSVSSADCRLMKLNTAGDALEETSTDEKVYSLAAIPGYMLIEVKQINGRPFAQVPAKLIKFGRMAAELSFGETGTLNVRRSGADTGETIDVVWDLFPGNSDPIATDRDVAAKWICDENLWRLLWADCPSGADTDLPTDTPGGL